MVQFISPFPSLNSQGTRMIEPRIGWRESFDRGGDICLHTRSYDLIDFYSHKIRVTRLEAIFPPWKIKEKVMHIRKPGVLKVPKTELGGGYWWWRRKRG